MYKLQHHQVALPATIDKHTIPSSHANNTPVSSSFNMSNTSPNMPTNTNTLEGVGDSQRRHVVTTLINLLKSCYPAQHEYLLLRAKQYESMCYTRASDIHHYYQLVNEGVSKIQEAYNTQLTAAHRSASANSAGQQVNAGVRDTPPVETTAQRVTPVGNSVANAELKTTDGWGNQAANSASIPSNQAHTFNAANPNNISNSANLANLPNSTNRIINPVPNRTNLPGPVTTPVIQKVNRAPVTMESYMVNPDSDVSPSPTTSQQLNQVSDRALNHMISTTVPSTRNPPITSVSTPVCNNAINPSLYQMARCLPPNQIKNPIMNPAANHDLNQMNTHQNRHIPNQMINQVANPGQLSAQNRAMVSGQMRMGLANSTRNLRPNQAPAPAPVGTTGPQPFQPHSEGVNQFLLSMGMIPAGMNTDIPTGVQNIQGMPVINSNQNMPIPQAPAQVPRQALPAQNTAVRNPETSGMSQVPVTVEESVSSQPTRPNREPHGRQANSASSSASKGTRPRAKTFQRSRSKKRNSSAAGINPQINPPARAHRVHCQTASKEVSNPIHFGVAGQSSQKLPVQAAAHTQLQPDSSNRQIDPSGISMNERIFIGDSIHVSIAQVYLAAASCGYRLTAETIRSLPKEQVLKFFVQSRQMALQKACELPRGANGHISASKKHLDALGVEYQTIDCMEEQTGTGTENLNGVNTSNLNSSSTIARHASLPANMRMNKIRTMPQATNSQTFAHQTNGSSRIPDLNQDSRPMQNASKRNIVQELPRYRGSREAAGTNLAPRRTSTSGGPCGLVNMGKENKKAQCKGNASQPLAVPSTGARESPVRGFGNAPNTSHNQSSSLAAKAENATSVKDDKSTQRGPADIGTFRNHAATLSSRVALFQQKYTAYKRLINQTLTYLLRMGHQGQSQELYLRYSMQLLTQPAAMGTALNLDVLNTTETFLRDFLVRFQGIPVKSKPGPSNQNAASITGGEAKNTANPNNASNTQIPTAAAQAQDLKKANIVQGTNVIRTTKNESDRQAIPIEVQQANTSVKGQHSRTCPKATSGISSTSAVVPSNLVSHEENQAMTQTDTAASDQVLHTHPAQNTDQNMNQTRTESTAQNQHALIAQKVKRVDHYVRMALHAVDKCEKKMEEESMLRLKEERIAEVCYVFQADNMKKTHELKEKANAEREFQPSLLDTVKEECEEAYKKHKKLMINIEEEWNKPVVECLLAYQGIRLPKIVIHVSGTYRNDLSASFGFERPPFGWVSVLQDVKKRFNALMEEREGVNGILDAWATAAEEVLVDEDSQNQ